MYRTIRASAISFKPAKWDKAGNADKIEAFFVEAAKEDPDLIVTTEGALEGYVINDVLERPELEQRVYEVAEPMDGPYIRRFEALARKLETCLVFGFAELVGSSVYNTAVFIDHRGEISGKYHKTQFAEGTVDSCRFNCVGKTLRAFDTPVGRVGIVICNDRWNPRITRTLVLDGARLILIPSYGSKTRRPERDGAPEGPRERRADRQRQRRNEPDREPGRDRGLPVGQRHDHDGGGGGPRGAVDPGRARLRGGVRGAAEPRDGAPVRGDDQAPPGRGQRRRARPGGRAGLRDVTVHIRRCPRRPRREPPRITVIPAPAGTQATITVIPAPAGTQATMTVIPGPAEIHATTTVIPAQAGIQGWGSHIRSLHISTTSASRQGNYAKAS